MPRTLTKNRIALLAGVVALVLAAPTTAGAASSDPGLCLDGGWQHVQADDGGRFKSEKDCLHYVTKGGSLYTPRLIVVVFCFSANVDLGVFASGFHPGSVATLTLDGALWDIGSHVRNSRFEDQTGGGRNPGELIVQPGLHIPVVGGATTGSTPITLTLRDAEGVTAVASTEVSCPGP